MTDIFNLLFLILLKQLTGLHCTIPDPCPDINPTTKVVDMCSDNYAIEETEDGSFARDSVVVRVINQTEGCICHVSAEYQNDPIVLYIRKYKNLESAAPVQEKCGLEVNIAYEEAYNILKMYSMTCTERQEVHSFALLKGGILSLTSNVIDGNFTRGYCIEIGRALSSEQNLALRIVCADPGILPSTLLPQPTLSMMKSRSTESLKHPQTYPISETTDANNPMTHTQVIWISKEITSNSKPEANLNSEDNTEVGVTVAAGIGWTLAVIFGILFIILLYKRRRNSLPTTSIDTNMQYDGLSVSRDVPNYSVVNRPITDAQQYETVHGNSEYINVT